MQRRDGYGSLAPPGAAETLLARRVAVMFGLTILLVGGTLAVRQRAVREAAAARHLVSVASAQELDRESLQQLLRSAYPSEAVPEVPAPRPGSMYVAVDVQVKAGGAKAPMRPEDVRLYSEDGRQVFTVLGEGIKAPGMFEPVDQVGAQPPQGVKLVFEVPDTFRTGKAFYWGGEVGEVKLAPR